MNRAFPALGLLLGSLMAALVAVGVASDLKRAGHRCSTATVDRTSAQPADFRLASICLKITVDWRRWTQQLVAVTSSTQPAKLPSPTARPSVDYCDLAKILADGRPGDTSVVDELIRTSDGIVERQESNVVPYGHVRVGGRLVKLTHRGRPLEVGEAWTWRLHYEPNRRAMLTSPDPATALTQHRVASLPGDKLLLWSEDRRALADWTIDASAAAFDQFLGALHTVEHFIRLSNWSQQKVYDGWAMLTNHMKRQAWLATLPSLHDAVPIRSALRLRGGKS